MRPARLPSHLLLALTLVAGCSVESGALVPTDGGTPFDGAGCIPEPEACNGRDDDCDGSIDEVFDLTSDPLHCGACDSACSSDPMHAASNCIASTCGVVCDDGFANCDGFVDNGCESALSSPSACGGCGTTCDGATPLCQIAGDGTASCVASCAAGLMLCGDRCVDTRADASNCGVCGTICPARAHASSACDGGSCSFRCDDGYATCDGRPATGCESSLDSPTTCGACGTDCTTGMHGTGTCVARACELVCDVGWGDCNTTVSDGCERRLNTPADCGGCGVPCTRANATASCSTGACLINMCNSSFASCDGLDSTGCEADLRTAGTCGTCTTACMPTQTCSGGVCAPACTTGVSCTSGCSTSSPCDCSSGTCALTCATDCEARCSGGSTTCSVLGNGSNTVDARCQSGATCSVSARSTASATVRCENSSTSCTVDCTMSSSCGVTCVSGARCELLCTGSSSCSFSSCEGGSGMMSCSGNRVVCNRAC